MAEDSDETDISAVSEKYDPLVDLTPVALVISAPFIFVGIIAGMILARAQTDQSQIAHPVILLPFWSACRRRWVSSNALTPVGYLVRRLVANACEHLEVIRGFYEFARPFGRHTAPPCRRHPPQM